MPNFFRLPYGRPPRAGNYLKGGIPESEIFSLLLLRIMSMDFTLQHRDPASQARVGTLRTDHGDVPTPIFMPVGTAATVKGLFHRDVRDEAHARIILANTYHLYLRPGMRILEEAGGVHRFSTWEGPMLTDSGGFQVFSLAACRKLKEEGCHFRSHIDGSKHLFTPESVIDTERTIGADIMMAFDECPPGDAPREYAARSLALTERWLDRCFDRYRQTAPKYGHYQALFPIVQGCAYADLRARAAENVLQYDADGYISGATRESDMDSAETYNFEWADGNMVRWVCPTNEPEYNDDREGVSEFSPYLNNTLTSIDLNAFFFGLLENDDLFNSPNDDETNIVAMAGLFGKPSKNYMVARSLSTGAEMDNSPVMIYTESTLPQVGEVLSTYYDRKWYIKGEWTMDGDGFPVAFTRKVRVEKTERVYNGVKKQVYPESEYMVEEWLHMYGEGPYYTIEFDYPETVAYDTFTWKISYKK